MVWQITAPDEQLHRFVLEPFVRWRLDEDLGGRETRRPNPIRVEQEALRRSTSIS